MICSSRHIMPDTLNKQVVSIGARVSDSGNLLQNGRWHRYHLWPDAERRAPIDRVGETALFKTDYEFS